MSEPRGTTAQLSAKIMEAQVYFQKVVKQELQVLVASGHEREVAVKMLLRRIVQSTYEPEESDVKRVMRQFQMIHDDAVRALIVKQEIGRLKRQGLDAFAAIELLTRKMQGISVPDLDKGRKEGEGETNEEPVHDDMSDHSSNDAAESSISDGGGSPAPNEEMHEDPHTHETGDEQSSTDIRPPTERPETSDTAAGEEESSVPSQSESPGDQTQESTSAASLSLCERIDQVSISAASPEASQTDQTASPTASPALSTVHTTPRTAFTLFSAHSRKRRATSGLANSLPEFDDAPLSPRISVGGPSTSSNHRAHFSMSRPMSPTFRFPKMKKQKIWTDDENNEPLLEAISFKETSLPPPASPTGVGTTNGTPVSSTTATPTKAGKRRRTIMGGSSSPQLDELDVEEPTMRVSKRHKLGAELNF